MASNGNGIEAVSAMKVGEEPLRDAYIVQSYYRWSSEFYGATFMEPTHGRVAAFGQWMKIRESIHFHPYEVNLLTEWFKQLAEAAK